MIRLRSRVALASAAVLIGYGVVSGCGDDGTVTEQPDAAAAETGTQAAPATTAAPAVVTTTSVAAGASATTAAAAPVETRTEILQLEGALLDGQQFDTALTAGNDVLLWFWAPW